MSLSQIEAATKGALSVPTLGGMIHRKDPRVAGVKKDPNHPNFQIISEQDAQGIITEGNKINRLREAGYTVSIRRAAGELGIDSQTLKARDLGQEEILGTWNITDGTFERLRKEGYKVFPRVKNQRQATHRIPYNWSHDLDHGLGSEWMPKSEIPKIEGALLPPTYMTRMYRYMKSKGSMPPWVVKSASGRILFKRSYLEGSAQEQAGQSQFLSIPQAARMVGASIPTMRKILESGVVPGIIPRKGQQTRIPHESLLPLLPQLQARLASNKQRAALLRNRSVVMKPPEAMQPQSPQAMQPQTRPTVQEELKVYQTRLTGEEQRGTIRRTAERAARKTVAVATRRVRGRRIARPIDPLADAEMRMETARKSDDVDGYNRALADKKRALAQRAAKPAVEKPVKPAPPERPQAKKFAPPEGQVVMSDEELTVDKAMISMPKPVSLPAERTLQERLEHIAEGLVADANKGDLSLAKAIEFFDKAIERNDVSKDIARQIKLRYFGDKAKSLRRK